MPDMNIGITFETICISCESFVKAEAIISGKNIINNVAKKLKQNIKEATNLKHSFTLSLYP